MKYLKYLLGIIALLTVLFIGNGFITPSVAYDSEIVVDKPIKEAWAVMNDESKVTLWLKDITNMEHVSGEKGTVGAVTKYTFNDGSQESVIFETIKAIRPNEYVAMNFVMEGVMDMEYEMNFSEKDEKTHIKSSTVNKGVSMFMRSMVSFMKGSMQAQEDENLSNLKKVIEENTTNYFPEPVVESVEEMQE